MNTKCNHALREHPQNTVLHPLSSAMLSFQLYAGKVGYRDKVIRFNLNRPSFFDECNKNCTEYNNTIFLLNPLNYSIQLFHTIALSRQLFIQLFIHFGTFWAIV